MNPEIAEVWEQLRRVVGKGIHPYALSRLLEICPTAIVVIKHYRPIYTKYGLLVTMRGTTRYLNQLRNEGGEVHFGSHGGKTEVNIAEGPGLRPTGTGYAYCHHDDPFCLETGRRIAFSRAMRRFGKVTLAEEEDARGMTPEM